MLLSPLEHRQFLDNHVSRLHGGISYQPFTGTPPPPPFPQTPKLPALHTPLPPPRTHTHPPHTHTHTHSLPPSMRGTAAAPPPHCSYLSHARYCCRQPHVEEVCEAGQARGLGGGVDIQQASQHLLPDLIPVAAMKQKGRGGGSRRHVQSQQEWHALPRKQPTARDRCKDGHKQLLLAWCQMRHAHHPQGRIHTCCQPWCCVCFHVDHCTLQQAEYALFKITLVTTCRLCYS
jgi:hypothetical protein